MEQDQNIKDDNYTIINLLDDSKFSVRKIPKNNKPKKWRINDIVFLSIFVLVVSTGIGLNNSLKSMFDKSPNNFVFIDQNLDLGDMMISNPILDFNFDEIVPKENENKIDLTLINGSQIIWPENYDDGKLHFDGVDDYAVSDRFNIDDNQFTVSLWMKMDKLSSSQQRILYTSDSVIDLRKGNGSTFDVSLKTENATPDGSQGNFEMKSVGSMKQKTWIHLALVYDGKELKLYRDGNVVESIEANGNLSVGGFLYLSDEEIPFDGEMDDVRIYTQALTAEQIEKII